MKFSFFFKRVALEAASAASYPPFHEHIIEMAPQSPIPQKTHDAGLSFAQSKPVMALRETIVSLEQDLRTSFLPLGATLMSLWHAIENGALSRHKAILLVGFSPTEEKKIADALKHLLDDWRDYAILRDLAVGLSSDHKGQLTQMTTTQENQLHWVKNIHNGLAKYAEAAAFVVVFVLANLFNDGRIFNPTGSLGNEYGDDAHILKHITFTQFDLLILCLAPAFALLTKQWYLANWQSPIVTSPSEVPYAEIRDADATLLKGDNVSPGAFHRAHGGILWVGPAVFSDTTCRNLLRTGLTQGSYETPLGVVPNAFLMIGAVSDVGVMAGTENDGRFTVIAKQGARAKVIVSPLGRSVREEARGIETPKSFSLKTLQQERACFIAAFSSVYECHMSAPSATSWQTMRAQIVAAKEQSPLAFMTGLDALMDKIFVNLEKRDKCSPYLALFSGPYGAAKTTIGKEVARVLAQAVVKPENRYYALQTQGGRLALGHGAAPYVPAMSHLLLRQGAAFLMTAMALMFLSVNVAVTDKYQKENVSFQDSLDRLQFSWMLLFAWTGLSAMVLKAGYEVSRQHDKPETLVMDFSTENTVGSANEDLSIADLIGKQVATTGFPHNRYAFGQALLLQHAGLFAENWDAIHPLEKQKILESLQSHTLQIPTGHTVPTRTQFLVATTNHPSGDTSARMFAHEAFSLVVPWQENDDLMIVANIISNTEPHTPYWDQAALAKFLDSCRNKASGAAVLTRQVLVDLVRDIGNLAYYESLPCVDAATVERIWEDRVFKGPLVEIRAACHEVGCGQVSPAGGPLKSQAIASFKRDSGRRFETL
jgi:hypothetical protein